MYTNMYTIAYNKTLNNKTVYILLLVVLLLMLYIQVVFGLI